MKPRLSAVQNNMGALIFSYWLKLECVNILTKNAHFYKHPPTKTINANYTTTTSSFKVHHKI